MTEHQINNEGRTSGTDVSNLGDTATIAATTPEGKEIRIRLYGR